MHLVVIQTVLKIKYALEHKVLGEIYMDLEGTEQVYLTIALHSLIGEV